MSTKILGRLVIVQVAFLTEHENWPPRVNLIIMLPLQSICSFQLFIITTPDLHSHLICGLSRCLGL